MKSLRKTVLFLGFFCGVFLLHGISAPFYQDYVIDNFEDGNVTQSPFWWTFGALNVSVEENEEDDPLILENFSARFTGATKKGFVGGMGTFFGVDGTRYNAVKLLVFGNKKKGGVIRIELFDDDNGNWVIEPDKEGLNPAFDDKFVYSLSVNWEGWREVILPFSHFVVDNLGKGDGQWNPHQQKGSGGLLQTQLLFFANKAKGKIDMKIDYIKFVQLPASISPQIWESE